MRKTRLKETMEQAAAAREMTLCEIGPSRSGRYGSNCYGVGEFMVRILDLVASEESSGMGDLAVVEELRELRMEEESVSGGSPTQCVEGY